MCLSLATNHGGIGMVAADTRYSLYTARGRVFKDWGGKLGPIEGGFAAVTGDVLLGIAGLHELMDVEARPGTWVGALDSAVQALYRDYAPQLREIREALGVNGSIDGTRFGIARATPEGVVILKLHVGRDPELHRPGTGRWYLSVSDLDDDPDRNRELYDECADAFRQDMAAASTPAGQVRAVARVILRASALTEHVSATCDIGIFGPHVSGGIFVAQLTAPADELLGASDADIAKLYRRPMPPDYPPVSGAIRWPA